MFDPVHNGHIQAASFALDQLALDKLKMIPCHHPNHRDSATSNPGHRLKMLELASAGFPAIEVDPMEIDRAGISYTVETLSALKQADEEQLLVFVLGLDSFNSLPLWHRWIELTDLCHFLVLARSGSSISEVLAKNLQLEQRIVESSEQLFEAASGKVFIATEFDCEISSTEVRGKLMAGEDLSGELNEDVIAYIKQKQLYQ
jgi:nicotinate-nucleotide adenylyltransferase